MSAWIRPAAVVSALALALLALAGVAFGAWAILDDLADTTDDWHGVGVFLGAVLGVPSGVVLLLAAASLALMRRTPTRAYWCLLGAATIVGAMVMLAGSVSAYPLVAAPLPLAVMAVAVAGVSQHARPTSPAPATPWGSIVDK